MGFYVVWLPLEIALIWSRSRRMEGRSVITARAAGFLVAALETGAIVGALAGGALIDTLPLTVVLLVPAVAHRRLLLRDPVRGQGVAGAHRRHASTPSVWCSSRSPSSRSRAA